MKGVILEGTSRAFYKNKNCANLIYPGMFFSVCAGKTLSKEIVYIYIYCKDLQSKSTLYNG